MTIHTVKLSEINAPENNPRKLIHKGVLGTSPPNVALSF
jgi:hypothetical protein